MVTAFIGSAIPRSMISITCPARMTGITKDVSSTSFLLGAVGIPLTGCETRAAGDTAPAGRRLGPPERQRAQAMILRVRHKVTVRHSATSQG
jgi:hypothetical protein